MFLAKRVRSRKIRKRFWHSCFYLLRGRNPYLSDIFCGLSVDKFSSKTLTLLYENSLAILPKMHSPPIVSMVYLKKAQVNGKYNVQVAIHRAISAGDNDSALTLYTCFYQRECNTPGKELTLGERKSVTGGFLIPTFHTLEQTG